MLFGFWSRASRRKKHQQRLREQGARIQQAKGAPRFCLVCTRIFGDVGRSPQGVIIIIIIGITWALHIHEPGPRLSSQRRAKSREKKSLLLLLLLLVGRAHSQCVKSVNGDQLDLHSAWIVRGSV